MSILPKLTYRFNVISIKSKKVGVEINKLILKFMWKCKGPTGAKMILKKSKVNSTLFPYYLSIIIRECGIKNIDVYQWNRIGNTELITFEVS